MRQEKSLALGDEPEKAPDVTQVSFSPSSLKFAVFGLGTVWFLRFSWTVGFGTVPEWRKKREEVPKQDQDTDIVWLRWFAWSIGNRRVQLDNKLPKNSVWKRQTVNVIGRSRFASSGKSLHWDQLIVSSVSFFLSFFLLAPLFFFNHHLSIKIISLLLASMIRWTRLHYTHTYNSEVVSHIDSLFLVLSNSKVLRLDRCHFQPLNFIHTLYVCICATLKITERNKI